MARVGVEEADPSAGGVVTVDAVTAAERDVSPGGAGETEATVTTEGVGPEAPLLSYRPALDGLRAVAVLVVMAEHAGLTMPRSTAPLVPGGFLGVDVFLVISGFLITSLLLVEHRRAGRVDLRAFWLRRARRLLPAVAVMVAATSLLIAVADLPLDPRSARGDALAALGYVANWRFIVTDQSYFAAFGLPSPFRHLWSLSVEEQWYLVFPPFLVAAYALVKRRPALLLGGLLGMAAVSAAWMAIVHTPGKDPSRAYYGTDTRAHTLLVGAALAVVTVHFPGLVRRIAPVVPWAALAGLGTLAAFFHTIEGRDSILYQGGFMVVALVSAAVVAGVALPDVRGPVRWLLARRPSVAIGRISYGLYLWHWPIYLWLTPNRTGLGPTHLTIVRFAASFAVATVCYLAVEQPIRRHGLSGFAARARRAGVPGARPATITAVAAAAVVATVIVSTGGRDTSDIFASATVITAPRSSADIPTTIVEPFHPLPAHPGDRPLRVMVTGDSVGWSLGHPLVTEDGLMPDDVDMRLNANLGCTITPGVALIDGVEFEGRLCQDWREPARWTAFSFTPDVVVSVWGAWEVHDHVDDGRLLRVGSPEAAAAYQQAVADNIDETVAVAPDVRFAFLTVPCMDESKPRLGGAGSPRNDREKLAWVNGLTAEVAARYGDRAAVVDLGPLLCPDGEILTTVDGVRVRSDGVHFTADYAPIVWEYVEDRLRPWLSEAGRSGPGGAPPV